MKGPKNKKILLQKLGNRIKEVREDKELTQQELAAICDFEKSNMSRLEAGNTNPTVYTLHKIATALNVSLSTLLDLSENE